MTQALSSKRTALRGKRSEVHRFVVRETISTVRSLLASPVFLLSMGCYALAKRLDKVGEAITGRKPFLIAWALMTGPEKQQVWGVAAIYVISIILLLFFLALDVACLLLAKSLLS